MTQANHTFTAAQIARAAGLTRQAVAARLPAGQDCHFADLPLDWQLEITRRGVRRGFDNGQDFLSKLPEPWQSPLPWSQIPEGQRNKALKLKAALARTLATAPAPAAGPVEQAGLVEFAAEFGYSISARHWRRLVNRTIDRDAGEGNWERLEIYLDEKTFAVRKPKRAALRKAYVHQGLAEVFGSLVNRQNPTPADREFLWDAVLRHFERVIGELPATARTGERRLVKASLIHFLFQAFPERTLCATEASLSRRFDEKLKAWSENGRTPEALRDRRVMDSGNFRRPEFGADLVALRNKAIQLDGSEALAHRMLREQGGLSKEFTDYYPLDRRHDKSAVPRAIRDAITPEVDMCLPIRRGPWQARMAGPYIPRDWSGVKPGDWFNADDVTWNHYFKEQLPDGRWQILRGECLLMTDLRTGYPLDFLLIAGKYNGEHVRSLALRVHDSIGLPRCGFYFEKGVWASRMVTGDNRQGTPVHWREAENGLCDAGLGLAVRHATTPRAKPIEGLLHILQDRMRCIFGFVGFNERTENFERIQKLIARAQRGDAGALSQFPTMAEWRSKVREVLEEFANDPQNGKMLEGQSPAEAWAAELGSRPLKQLPEAARYVLSTHQKKIKVHQHGIKLTIRGKERLYYNEHTGPLIGKEVLAFYNIEMPELLTVCDMNRQNYFSVKQIELPAMDATREQLEAVNRARKGHMAHAKGIFGQLRHEVVSTITRDGDHTEQEKELGRFHAEEMEKAKTEKSAATRKVKKARAEAAARGVSQSLAERYPERILQAAEMRRIAEQLREQEAHE